MPPHRGSGRGHDTGGYIRCPSMIPHSRPAISASASCRRLGSISIGMETDFGHNVKGVWARARLPIMRRTKKILLHVRLPTVRRTKKILLHGGPPIVQRTKKILLHAQPPIVQRTKKILLHVRPCTMRRTRNTLLHLSLIHISEPTRRTPISYAVFCL